MAMRVNEHTAKNQYAAYALGAGRAERDGEYGKAAELWRRAANAPCNASKQRWAQHSVRMRTSKAGGHTAMNARRFNQLYPVGTKFMHIPNPVLRGGRVSVPWHRRGILNVAALWK